MARNRVRPLPTMLCTLLLGVFALSAPAAEPGIADPKDDVKAIRAMLERIDGRMAAQQSQLTDALILINKLMSDMTTLRDEHARLQRELNDLKARPAGQTSSSYYPGTAGSSFSQLPSQAPLAARVRLVNTYIADMTAVINGVMYTVSPGTERTVSLAPGTMTYQVFMVADVPQTRSLAAGEELKLTLYPRR